MFATHSTHKLLAALSQTSYIHVRDGKGAIDHGRFNEAYCTQASTSPLYPADRQQRGRRRHDGRPGRPGADPGRHRRGHRLPPGDGARSPRVLAKKDWFFAPWNAPEVKDAKSGKKVPFADAPAELLATDPNCWVLHPGETWHGFDDMPDGWCLLDPIKFGIVCPGMQDDGKLAKHGIPGDLVTAYLGQHGIVPSRTTDAHGAVPVLDGRHQGQVGHADQHAARFQARLRRAMRRSPKAMPKVAAAARRALRRHGREGSRRPDVGSTCAAASMGHWEAQAYATLPKPEMLPRHAFQKLMAGDAELVPLAKTGESRRRRRRHPLSARHSRS